MRPMRWLLCGVAAVTAPQLVAEPAAAENTPVLETREQYLARLAYVCEVDCMSPRTLLRTARKRGSKATDDMAGVLDIVSVAQWNGKFLLLTNNPAFFDTNFLGQRTPTTFRPVTDPNGIVIEMDRETFFNLINVPLPGSEEARALRFDEDGGIIVERDRYRKFTKPTLGKLRSLFRNRRIVVRGKPRLEVAFVGARRDFRRKKLFLEVGAAADIVILPRYDKNGDPILDGPLAGLEQ